MEWLPDTMLSIERLRPLLSDVLRQWNTQWFRSAIVTVSNVRLDHEAHGDGMRLGNGRCCEISIFDSTSALLSRIALGCSREGLAAPEHDDRLLKVFVDMMLDNLLESLEPVFPASELIGGDSIVAICIAIEGQGGFWLHVTKTAACAAIVRSLSRKGLDAPRLVSRREAAGKTCVTLEAIVGTSAVSVSDLRTLSPGDVVLLDRPRTEPVDVRLPGNPITVAQANVVSDGDAVFLKIQ